MIMLTIPSFTFLDNAAVATSGSTERDPRFPGRRQGGVYTRPFCGWGVDEYCREGTPPRKPLRCGNDVGWYQAFSEDMELKSKSARQEGSANESKDLQNPESVSPEHLNPKP